MVVGTAGMAATATATTQLITVEVSALVVNPRNIWYCLPANPRR